ncbi:RHS repeat domain-containing protein [Alkalinema pantanalense CENA528]|uniref:RHS repeat domain-containing protein n=1 Tax=Alkalinema pantanalense TaxID=1620705 RepID=UPI003D6DE491
MHETTYFVYDRDHVALEFTGNRVTRYLYGPGVDQVLAQQVGDRTDWFLADHLGSTRALIDNSGVIQKSFTYDAFGKVVGESGNAGVDTRYRFTGREWDGESQQYYYRARYYDANTGRFIGQDPLGFAAGDSNLYRYVGNSPVMATDPSGMVSKEVVALIEASVRRPGKPTIAAYHEKFKNYEEALLTATNWFYIISDRNSRRQPPSNLPWLLVGKIKNDFGFVVLRPYGTQPREDTGRKDPTIEFQPEGKKKVRQYPEGAMGVTEVKFEYKEKKDDDGNKPCPVLYPKDEPELVNGRPKMPFRLPEIPLPNIQLPDQLPPIPIPLPIPRPEF